MEPSFVYDCFELVKVGGKVFDDKSYRIPPLEHHLVKEIFA